MGKKNRSKRLIQQGSDSVSLHDARFPYRMTLAEAEAQKERNNSPLGGI
ncbi:competence protein [Ectobacillus ponti]|uniref:Competence protein n=1 Tax=Ectobacillus ponti TaxID=2961894 RepID=A0AA41X3Z6_9BACI|nr:competence protein [Ectobacillus ponti]MCP8968282.1 competence protein [Ectobacillus ponti]